MRNFGKNFFFKVRGITYLQGKRSKNIFLIRKTAIFCNLIPQNTEGTFKEYFFEIFK